MNISTFKDSDYETKQEDAESKIVAKPNLTTSSWSRLKDPRIVRVSRAFGGKDRHSKVCTVRGLRDRRVRLSVPTAIQLYDLQDRLGVNQPSKVVDWLLDAAKTEIDELPPLQIPPGNFGQNLQAMINASNSSSHQISGKSTSINWEDYWNPDHKSKAIARENCEEQQEEDARNLNKHDYHHHGSRFFQSSTSNSSNLTGLLNNVDPNTCFLKWDPSSSNLSLSQLGSSSSYGSHDHQHHDNNNVHNFNINVAAALPSIPSGSLYHPLPPPQTQSYFPSHNNNSDELNYQTASYGMRPFHLSMNPKFFSSEDHNINGGPHQQPNK